MVEVGLLSIVADYGLPTAFAVFLGWFLIQSNKNHKIERGDWRNDIKDSNDKYHSSQKDNTEVLRQLTAVIQNVNNKK